MSDSVHVGVEVFVGVDIAKGDHYACAVTSTGEEVLARSVRNDETAIRCLIDDAKVYGAVALVIDTTSSAASLLMETAARHPGSGGLCDRPGDAPRRGSLCRSGQDRP